jgi:alkylated DNA repair dioxygenase AlkB
VNARCAPLLRSAADDCGETLLDGELGRIVLFADRVARADCERWFAALLQDIAWETERRPMYDRIVDVPRLFARARLDDADAHPVVRAAAQLARDVTGAQFDSAGLNLYRNEQDSVAWHNDKLHRLQPGAPIAIFSLGETRPLAIRTKRMPRKSLRIGLTPGSILLMSYETQLHLDHAILKERAPCGPRISLAFRRRGSAASAQA